MTAASASVDTDAFDRSQERFESLVTWFASDEAAALEHGALEARLSTDGRELLRQMYQDQLDLRAQRECRLGEVIDAEGVARTTVETDHDRTLTTVFGPVEVNRLAYRRRGHANLHPADGMLNLPEERHSHGLRRLAAIEATRGSYDGAVGAVETATGQHLGKRQAEELAQRASRDVDEFYRSRPRQGSDPDDVVVLACDGKGIVMRPEALRPATAKAAARATTKLKTRLSKGEKRNRKRIAEVGAVYEATPAPRTSDDIFPPERHEPEPGPKAYNKWLTASVVEDAATVVGQIFDEADRRDPGHERTWVALVDGNDHQIDRVEAEAEARGIDVPIVVDVVHVIEYLWGAAWCFYAEGDSEAEQWVREKATAVLDGHATRVAAAIRRKATFYGLDPPQRETADRAAAYLCNKAAYLDYPTALEWGWSIATGVTRAHVDTWSRIGWT